MSRRPKHPGADLQRNAADPDQVRYAQRKTEDRARRELAAWHAVLDTSEGRIVLFAVLGMARLYASVQGLEGAALAMACGEREVGLRVAAACVNADEDLFDLMAKEHRAFVRREAIDHAAARTPSADDTAEDATE